MNYDHTLGYFKPQPIVLSINYDWICNRILELCKDSLDTPITEESIKLAFQKLKEEDES